MDISKGIDTRRAYRSLEHVDISVDTIRDLARYAGLAPSCFNKQPWRFVFVYEPEQLEKVFETLSKGNKWARKASMIIAVFSRRDQDCLVKGREYFLFDTGMATAFLILRATELGLVAHPIAGYDEDRVKSLLGIPDDMRLITLVVVGKKSDKIGDLLSDKQAEIEKERPLRKDFEAFGFLNQYSKT
jgi:nitroreductase